MARAKRIVCYAVNGSGLGHVTRLIAVARWMRRFGALLDGRPPEILFLTSTEATQPLADEGFAAFKVPSKTVVRRSGLDPREYRRLARHFIWSTLGALRPDLLVVDTFPSGSFDELFQVLDGPQRNACIQRRVKPEYARRPVFRAALGLYDVVVAPHAGPRGGASEPTSGVRYSGEVLQLEREESLARAAVRAELGVEVGQRLVYLSAGGGGDPTSQATLEALVAALRAEPDLHLLVGAGPLYRGPTLHAERLSFWRDAGLALRLGACDAALSAAGYNSFHELLFTGVPAAFYAQAKVADDQLQRIQQAAERGACLHLEDPLDPDGVRATLRALLSEERAEGLRAAAAQLRPRNGAARCARLLLEPLYGEAPLQDAELLVTPRLALAFESGREPCEGASLMGRVLGMLLPPAGAANVSDAAVTVALERLLPQLSEDASAELRGLMAQAPELARRSELQEALVELLTATEELALPEEGLVGLVGAALKKHPLRQELRSDWLAWAGAVARGLPGVLQRAAGADEPAGAEDLLQIYRVFPRLHDCGAEESFRLFARVLERSGGGGLDSGLLHRLRALKMAHRQVGREQLRPLVGEAAP